MKERTIFEQKLKQLEITISEKESKIQSLQSIMEDQQKQKSALEQQHQTEVNLVKEKYANQERILQEKIYDAEKKSAQLIAVKDGELKELEHRLELMSKSKDATETALSSLKLQMQNLSSRKEEIQVQLETMNEKFETSARRLAECENMTARQLSDINEYKKLEQSLLYQY